MERPHGRVLAKLASCITCGQSGKWEPEGVVVPAEGITQHTVKEYGAPWWRQVWVLAVRETRLVTRNPADIAGRTLVFSWAGIMVGFVFFALPLDVQGLRSRGYLMNVEVMVIFLLPFIYMSLFTADKAMVTADLASRLYRPSAYYVAKAALIFLFNALNAVVFLGIVYGMSGLRKEGAAAMEHLLIGGLGYMVSSQVLYIAATITPNQDIAFMVAIAWTAVNVLLSNYPIRIMDFTMQWVEPLR